MKKLITVCAVFAVLLVIAAPGGATLISVGEIVVGNSWSQGFNETGVGNFDLVAVEMLSAGDSFETPAHSGFSDGSWALLYEDTPPTPTLASASGTATNNLTWSINFTGDSSNPLIFNFVAFNGESLLECANAVWNGGGWSITAGTWNPSRSDVLPEPATICLLAFGAIAILRKK